MTNRHNYVLYKQSPELVLTSSRTALFLFKTQRRGEDLMRKSQTIVVALFAATALPALADTFVGQSRDTLTINDAGQAVWTTANGTYEFTFEPTNVEGCFTAVNKTGFSLNTFCKIEGGVLAPIFMSVEKFTPIE